MKNILANTVQLVEEDTWTKTFMAELSSILFYVFTRNIGIHDGYYVFPGRLNPYTHHRTRQAVYKDMMRVLRSIGADLHCSPHSARKVYAVDKYQKSHDIEQIQRLLNHDYKSTTMIYAFSDLL